MHSNFSFGGNTSSFPSAQPVDSAPFIPYLSISATITSVVIAFLYTLLRDVSTAYVKAPKHFPKRGWLVSFAKPKLQLPFVNVKDGNYTEALTRGSEEHPDQAFRIPHHPHEWVILPHRLIDEAKAIPESRLSFQQGSYDFFMGWHTGITNHERVVANILKSGVNRLIDAVYSIVQDESLRTVIDQIGPCEDWTEVSLLPKTVGMIMAISQRVFVGEPLCRSKDWLLAIMHVTQNAFGSVPSLWPYSPWTRPFIAWRHPGLKSVRENREKAKKMLKPILDERLAKLDEPGFEAPPDLMQFVLDATKKNGEGRSLDYQVNAIIGTGRAALFTTGITIYHLVYDLAARPEYVEMLREEAREFADLPMTRANVNKMTKMDSFIRESQRFSKFMLVGTFRKCMKDITFSDGTFLPKGTYVGTNVEDATFKHSTLPNPEVFDGMRWHNMRLEEGKENMYSSVQTSSDHLVYGMGNQACPGRFFAAHEARVVTSRIIMNYDFKLVEEPKNGHPMAHADGVMTTVDPNVKFMFKKRNPV